MSARSSLLVGIGAVAAIGLIRAGVLFAPGVPSGIDGGNWLAFGTFGRPGVTYPPLVPTLFAGGVALLGAGAATAVAGALATAAPAIAVLGVLSWAGRAGIGALAAVATVASGAVGEIAAWGGYPQPIATAFAIVALVSVARWLAVGARISFALFAVSFACVVATSHLVAIPALAAVLLAMGASWLQIGRPAIPRAALAVAALMLPFILLARTYADLLATLGDSVAGGAADAERVLGFAWPISFAALLAPLAALGLARFLPSVAQSIESRDIAVMTAVSAAGVAWIMAYVVAGEPRLLYDIAVLAILGAAAVVPLFTSASRAALGRRIAVFVAFLAVVATTASGMAGFPAQVRYYGVLSPDRFTAIEWLAVHAPPGADAILVADVAGVPIGWWVEGIVGREVLFAGDFRWLRFSSERDRARLANAFLYRSTFPTQASLSAAHDLGIQLVYLPSAGRFGIEGSDPPIGWRVVFQSGDAMVLAPTQPSAPIGWSDSTDA